MRHVTTSPPPTPGLAGVLGYFWSVDSESPKILWIFAQIYGGSSDYRLYKAQTTTPKPCNFCGPPRACEVLFARKFSSDVCTAAPYVQVRVTVFHTLISAQNDGCAAPCSGTPSGGCVVGRCWETCFLWIRVSLVGLTSWLAG